MCNPLDSSFRFQAANLLLCLGAAERTKHLASEVVSGVNAKLAAVVLVVPDAGVDCRWVLAVALESAVDCSNGGSESLARGYERVAVVHPVPQGGLEGDDDVVGDRLWRAEAVEPDAFPGGAIVEVPRQLDGAAAVVALPRHAWVLGVRLVAVVLRCAVDLLYVAEICRVRDELR